MKIMLKRRYSSHISRAHESHSFINGKIHFSDEDKRMYAWFGRLYKQVEELLKKK